MFLGGASCVINGKADNSKIVSRGTNIVMQ